MIWWLCCCCWVLMLELLRRSSRDSTNFGGKNARLSSYYIVSRHPIIVGSSDYFIVTFSHLPAIRTLREKCEFFPVYVVYIKWLTMNWWRTNRTCNFVSEFEKIMTEHTYLYSLFEWDKIDTPNIFTELDAEWAGPLLVGSDLFGGTFRSCV